MRVTRRQSLGRLQGGQQPASSRRLAEIGYTSPVRSTKLLLIAPFLIACTHLGKVPDRGVLSADARTLPPGADAGPGPGQVVAETVGVGDWNDGFAVSIYRPAAAVGPSPAVVFLPARAAPEWQYDSYARALASRGFVVALRTWYGFFRTDPELATDARAIARYLVAHGLARPDAIGIAGHSMGGKASIMAALADGSFRAVVAIDPDENGYTHVARGPIAGLHAPLLVIGAEDAWKAFRLCATKDGNYRSFFKHAPPGTVELTLVGADHVQVMDNPNTPGMGICRVGKVDSQKVRLLSRAATVAFFEQHLRGVALAALPTGPGVRQRVVPAPVTDAPTAQASVTR
jgi:dienelactone hydrolase